MLFKANISTSLISNEDRLVEQLYIFLNEFVKTRMRYESSQTVEDCVQDTVMYLITRSRGLPQQLDKDFNPEQFFYNRANSFVSMWLRRLINTRKQFKKYQGELEYIHKIETDSKPMYIDYTLLKSVIDSFLLDIASKDIMQVISIQKLIDLGYTADLDKAIPEEDFKDKNMDTLTYNVVDKYLLLDINQEE